MAVKLTLPPAELLSQVAKLGSLLALILLALLLPAFLRVAYGYLLFNGIVLALGIQAFVGSTASIADESSSTGQAVAPVGVAASPFQRAGSGRPDDRTAVVDDDRVVVLKKCPSTASIFFLSALNGSQAGGEEKGQQEEQDDFEVDLDGDVTMSRQELFANTERFIGNFRKELRMQRQ
ncbi:hypothetical protein CFC21_110687 [Triticum aestivum]|uniref:DUF4408 domain-containing protein n=2 Tax=Triticum aestivum TaxID=4565 RepID=A0A9R1MPD5_WHEAT|nr:hypothetical protein CFC21_110685 [Triticum aestivum]KAF7110600.1 hypothetical protein CFC21_110687 [Triticum aestivum]